MDITDRHSTGQNEATKLPTFVPVPHTDHRTVEVPSDASATSGPSSRPFSQSAQSFDSSKATNTTHGGSHGLPVPHRRQASEPNPRAGLREPVASHVGLTPDLEGYQRPHAVKIPEFKSQGPCVVKIYEDGL